MVAISVVERPFLHMLPEVYPLPDVKVFRFNIDSLYGSPSLGDLQVLSGAYVLPDGQWKKDLTLVYMLRTFLVTPYVNQLNIIILRKRACWLVW